jgi:hypothetical protein
MMGMENCDNKQIPTDFPNTAVLVRASYRPLLSIHQRRKGPRKPPPNLFPKKTKTPTPKNWGIENLRLNAVKNCERSKVVEVALLL